MINKYFYQKTMYYAMHNLKPKKIATLKALFEHNYYLTTTQVSNVANISWNNAKNYLEKMYQLYWIAKLEKGNRDYWQLTGNESLASRLLCFHWQK